MPSPAVISRLRRATQRPSLASRRIHATTSSSRRARSALPLIGILPLCFVSSLGVLGQELYDRVFPFGWVGT